VSKDYRVVQPAEVMDFFRKLTAIGGFQMETAGALSHGRRVWALARVGDGAPVVDGDLVKPYLLLGTSYDGTMATIAKFTAIRVVCNNTITPAVNGRADETDKGYLKSSVRVLHSAQFDADAVRLQLGIVADQFERFIVQSRQLARIDMNFTQADQFVQELLRPYHQSALEITDTKAYKRVIELWQGRAIGSDILSASKSSGSRWAMLNAVTQLVDHERGRSDNTRLESAWFGTGAALKNRALELLAA
jgi:phage/plasmid-like protein (TIGR03299 family)